MSTSVHTLHTARAWVTVLVPEMLSAARAAKARCAQSALRLGEAVLVHAR